MATKLMFESDLGAGLAVEGGKAVVKVDGTSIGVNSSGELERLGETFVASGTLPNGAVVALRSDGSVEVAGETPGTPFGGATTFSEVGVVLPSVAYVPTANKVVVAYRNNDSGEGTAVVGTVAGTSISFSSPVVFNSNFTDSISVVYDSANDRVVIAYTNIPFSTARGTAIVGTVSGTSISFGSPVEFSSIATPAVSAVFDSTNDKVVIVYTANSGFTAGTAIVGTVSGTSISFGSPVVFNSASTSNLSVAFDSADDRVVIAYRDFGNLSAGTAIVGTVSGTSISFGSPVVFNSAATSDVSAVFDSANNRVVIAYANTNSSGRAVVGTVSGTSISFGSAVVFNSANVDGVSAVFHTADDAVVIVYRDFSNAGDTTAIVGTVSDTSISFNSKVARAATLVESHSTAFDPINNKVVIAYNDIYASNKGTVTTFDTDPQPTSNADNWVGIAKAAAANAATVPVALDGETATNLSGLTAGAQYYVADDGSLTTTVNNRYIGRALSSTKLRIVGSGVTENVGVF